MNDKKILIILAILIVVIGGVVLTVTFVNKNSNKNNNVNIYNTPDPAKTSAGTKLSVGTRMLENKTFENTTFSRTEIYSNNGTFTFFADIKNTSKSERAPQAIVINILDNDGTKIVTLNTNIPKLGSEKEATIVCRTSVDLTKAYNFTIEVKK